jgi:DNA mismatch repair ATPase MutS
MTTKYPNSVNNFYFEYDSKDGELSFDYQLKEGVCKSFNASELLRSVGLKV